MPLGFFPEKAANAHQPESQETGPLPSFLRAGGMYRADEGQPPSGGTIPLANDTCVYV